MDLIQLKKTIDKKKSERERLIGQQDSYMEQLKELGFKTIRAAEKALDKMEADIEKIQAKYNDDLDTFEDKYKDLIYDN